MQNINGPRASNSDIQCKLDVDALHHFMRRTPDIQSSNMDSVCSKVAAHLSEFPKPKMVDISKVDKSGTVGTNTHYHQRSPIRSPSSQMYHQPVGQHSLTAIPSQPALLASSTFCTTLQNKWRDSFPLTGVNGSPFTMPLPRSPF